ncbi:MAG TPA: hypothetical protein VMV29_15160, partial [Ktedonobacterales bacterium]|nr:hypothetical protein [Ktedonobacterales bacterium]
MRQEQGTQQPWTMVVEVLSALGAWNMAVRLRLRALVARQRRRVGTALLLALFLLSSTLGFFVQNGGVAMAAPVSRGPQPGTSAQPTNTLASANLTDLGKRVIVLPQTKGHTATSAQATTPPSPIARPTGITMKSATISLSASASATHATTVATTWTSSDQRLTVTVPAGAVTPALLTAGSGGVSLQVKQLAGASGGMGMGASGRISLGTYQFSLVGSHGPIHAALAKPIALSLSLKGWQGAGFDLSHVIFVVDGSAPVSAYLDTTTGKLNTALVSAKPQPFAATLNRAAGSLDVAIPLAGSGTTNGTWNTDSPQAHWDAQTDTGVDLSSGDLTYSYPLDVPPGPGGLTPNLTMSYDSSSVANEHNPQATSGWLGEGWNMSLGSITWGEHNVYTSNNCTFSNCTCTLINCTIWDNMWQFSDAFGNGGQLIPQDSNVSPWYDDSIHGQVPTPNEPIAWNVASEPRIKIESYTNPTANNNFPSQYYPTQPPCFRVFLPNGSMEEFGCTVDSLEFYVDQNPFSSEYKGNYISSWNLDMIVDPNGNQIHITYNRYENYDKVDGATQFPIDAVPATVTYDSPSCHSTTTMCTGSSWQPQAQIVFNSATAAARLTGAVCPTFQNTTTYLYGQTMRCDDVQDLSHNTPAGLASPALQSLAILNDVQVQVSTSGSSPVWKTLRDYKFSYDQSAATTTAPSTPDPVSGQAESIAGHLVLTKIQEMGDDNATTLPPLTMTYTPQVETYVDTLSLPAPTTNCGPTWNTYSGCPLWSEFTGYYLTDMTNGQGWDETYTYALAHNNTHGVNTGLTLEDPLTCNGANQSSSPCRLADDENWSKYVVTQRQASVQCVLANGSGCGSNHTAYLTSTTSYTYRLTDLVGKECSGCAAGMYWGNQNDGDTLDFYNATFMGFHTTQVSSPDGSQQLYTFESGDGYGIADSNITCYANFNIPCTVVPWTDSANFLHGQVVEEDDYDTNGTTLLKKTTSSFVSGATACPPNGISGSPYNATDPHGHFVGQRTSELDINNPVTVCEIEPAQSVASVYDGSTSHVDTTTTDTYTYDGSGHMTVQTQDTAASDASQTPHVTQKTQFTWRDAITTSGTSASGVYFNMLAGIQTTEDGSGNVKACAYTGYDGGTVGATGSQAAITKGLMTESTRYSTNCTPGSLSGPVSTLRTYNSNGDLLATQDADAVAGVSGHTTTACAYNSVNYTACAAYDSLYSSQVASVENDLNQTTGLGYQDTSSSATTPDPVNGWGQWLTSMTDANSQKTLYEYDPLGRLTAIAKPGAAYGDTYASPTTSYAYPITCATTGAQEPCASLTTTQRLAGSDTTTSATYYDGWGRAVETVTPSSLSGTTCTVSVSYTEYDASGRKAFVSDP